MDVAIALSVLALLVVANGVATRVVVRDPYTEWYQKVFQLLAVWLVPVFGAILVFALHRKPERATGQYRESRDPLDEHTTSQYVGRSIGTRVDDQP
jgi:hypothetical protein